MRKFKDMERLESNISTESMLQLKKFENPSPVKSNIHQILPS